MRRIGRYLLYVGVVALMLFVFDVLQMQFALRARDRLAAPTGTSQDLKAFRMWLTILVATARLESKVMQYNSQEELKDIVSQLQSQKDIFYWESVEGTNQIAVFRSLRLYSGLREGMARKEDETNRD